MSNPLWPVFSDLRHVHDAIVREAWTMGSNPYPRDKVLVASKTITDLVEEIRIRFGDEAAESITIVVH